MQKLYIERISPFFFLNLKLPRASLINPEIVGALRPSSFGAAFSKVGLA